MSTSYQFASEHNSQSLIYGASVAAGRLWSWLVIAACMAIGVAVGAVLVAVVVAFWLPIVQVAGCLVVIALFAVATYPKAVQA